jgi:hypothetical protein
MLRSGFSRILLDPAPVDGGAVTPPPLTTDADKIAAALVTALKRHNGDGESLARDLLAENHGVREKNRALTAKLPPEGSVVLTGDDVKAWAELGTMGGLTKVKTELSEGQTARSEVVKIERSKSIAKAAATLDYDAEVLESLAPADAVFTVVEDVKLKKNIASIKIGDTQTPLAEYAKTHLAKFLPSLLPVGGTTPRVSPGTPRIDASARTSEPNFAPRPNPISRPDVQLF